MDMGFWYYIEGVGVTVMLMVILASLASLRTRRAKAAGGDHSTWDSDDVYGVTLADRKKR